MILYVYSIANHIEPLKTDANTSKYVDIRLSFLNKKLLFNIIWQGVLLRRSSLVDQSRQLKYPRIQRSGGHDPSFAHISYLYTYFTLKKKEKHINFQFRHLSNFAKHSACISTLIPLYSTKGKKKLYIKTFKMALIAAKIRRIFFVLNLPA